MCDILPGILEKDWNSIEAKLEKVKDFSKAVHVDIIDGKFADNKTFIDPKPFKKFSNKLFLEVHMMVEEPINYLQSFSDAGFKRFMGHVERMTDQVEFVAKAQMLGEVGLAIDGPTDLSSLKVNLQDLDALLIMTIKAGFSGQKFNQELLKKVEAIRKRIQEEQLNSLVVEVDGGINNETIVQAKNAGASRFIATSFLFSGNPQERIKELHLLTC